MKNTTDELPPLARPTCSASSDTPKTDIELAVSKGRLTHHLVALCRRMERERNAFERQYERFRNQEDAANRKLEKKASISQRMEILEKENDMMRTQLEHIADASPSKWEMRSGEFQMQFHPWAQNRARHTISGISTPNAKVSGPVEETSL